MNEEDRGDIVIEYTFKVIDENFPFDQIRVELEQHNIKEEEISTIIKEIDDLVLSNTVGEKIEKSRYSYKKSGIGILVTLILFLFYLAYRYELIVIENMNGIIIILLLVVISTMFYKKVKNSREKFLNRNKFRND